MNKMVLVSVLICFGVSSLAFAQPDSTQQDMIMIAAVHEAPTKVLKKEAANSYMPPSESLFSGTGSKGYPLDASYTELPDDSDQIPYLPRLTSNDTIILSFYSKAIPNGPQPIGALKITAINIESEDGSIISAPYKSPGQQEASNLRFPVYLGGKLEKKFTILSELKVTVTFADNETFDRYFILNRVINPYGYAMFPFLGLWAPVTLIGSNLNITSTGLLFSTLPATLAIGDKINYSLEDSTKYIGISLAGGYAFGGTPPNFNEVGTVQDFFLSNADLFGLLDFGGDVYAGAGSSFDLTQVPPKISILLVFGLGPDLLSKVK